MNVVHSGENYQIYGDSVETFRNLPAKIYNVGFDKFTGFYLTEHDELSVSENKIYGNASYRVDKVINGFIVSDRNFGVILSGYKGSGKSLFAKLLSNKASTLGYPVIVVSEYIPGITKFLASIKQHAVILFDEFDKTFAKVNNTDPQEELLTLFDGVDSSDKKLFVLICNESYKLNPYLINRPGRFHYHFILGELSANEVREYLNDKLLDEYKDAIDRVVKFSTTAVMTYDILRAITFELNMGYTLDETIADLNISKEWTSSYNVVVKFNSGAVWEAKNFSMNLYSDEYYYLYPRVAGVIKYGELYFKPSDLIMCGDGVLTLPVNKLYAEVSRYDLDDSKDEAEYEAAVENLSVAEISFSKSTVNLSNKYIL